MLNDSTQTLMESRSSRKERGAFYTPPELASYLVDYAVRTSHDCVLEPSCGEGEFLVAAAQRLRSLGTTPNSINKQLVAYELHAATVARTQSRLNALGYRPQIICGDFFREEPSSSFDVVLGNPPYIRFQDFSGSERAIARGDALRAGVNIDAQASAWAPFIVHASLFLRDGGRMAFVLPAELLSTNYAAPVRRYLLNQFSTVELILFEESVFPGVQEEVVLLMADGFRMGSTDSLQVRQLFSIDDLRHGDTHTIEVSPDGRWPIGQQGQEALEALANLESQGFVGLKDWGSVRLGAVTGNNAFFALTESEVRAHGLVVGRDVIPLCPPGSRHLRRLSFGASDWRRLADSGRRVYLFYPAQEPSAAAEKYIEGGVANGVHNAYKCRVRSPWWRVPGVKPCDAFITYMNGFGPNICCNNAGVAYLNSVHGIFFRGDVRSLAKEELPLLALSSVSLLSAEVRGRSYGGGVLKLEPREALEVLVPTVDAAEELSVSVRACRPEVEKLLQAGDHERASKIVDELLVREGVVSSDVASRCSDLRQALATRRKTRGVSNRTR